MCFMSIYVLGLFPDRLRLHLSNRVKGLITVKSFSQLTKTEKMIGLTILVSALGYFVDIFDLLLFSIVRKPSLIDLGVPESELLSVGIRLLNTQMLGLFLGGILWGIMGDRRGRAT